MRPLLTASTVLVLSACAGAPAVAPANAAAQEPAASQAQCNVAGLDTAVGQMATPERLDQLKAASGSRSVRVGRPGMAMTMDFRPDRLTVHVDGDNRIVKLVCG